MQNEMETEGLLGNVGFRAWDGKMQTTKLLGNFSALPVINLFRGHHSFPTVLSFEFLLNRQTQVECSSLHLLSIIPI